MNRHAQAALLDAVQSTPPYPWAYYEGPSKVLSFVRSALEQAARSKGMSWAPLPAPALDPACVDDADAPQRALAAQVVRAQNAVLVRLMQEHPGTKDPIQDLLPAFVPGEPSTKVHQQFEQFLRVDNFAQRKVFQHLGVLDVRDFGLGLNSFDLLDVFETLLQDRPWAIKQTLSARPSYMHAPFTLVASRRQGCRNVAITAIKRIRGPKGALYHVLVGDDGLAPQIAVPEDQFAAGTLVRFIGFEGKLYNGFKERSVQGALDRLLPRLSFPVPVKYHELGLEEPRTQARLAVGAMHRLDRLIGRGEAHCKTAGFSVDGEHVGVHRYELQHKPAKHNSVNDELRYFCCPREPVLFVNKGQTIASTARPNVLENSKLAIIDCSQLPALRRQEICTDKLLRDALALKGLTKLEADLNKPEPIVAEVLPPRPTELPPPSRPRLPPIPAAPKYEGYAQYLRSKADGVLRFIGLRLS